MSSAAAEAVVNIDFKHLPTSSSLVEEGDTLPYPSTSTRPDSYAYASVELYTPESEYDAKASYFDGDLGSPLFKPGSSSDGLTQRGGYFDRVAVLEKGDGPIGDTPGLRTDGAVPTAPTFAITPFVLEDTATKREGGWAGWTCVAGSWLTCASPADDTLHSSRTDSNSVCDVRLRECFRGEP